MSCGVALLPSSCGTSLECGFWVFFTIWMFVVVCGETGDDAWRVMFTTVNACPVTENRGVYNNHQQTIASSHSILQLSAASSSVTQAKGKLWLCLPGKCLMAYGEEWPWVRQSRNWCLPSLSWKLDGLKWSSLSVLISDNFVLNYCVGKHYSVDGFFKKGRQKWKGKSIQFVY